MKNPFLAIMTAICIVYTLIRLGEFTYNHIPPYKEGQCYSSPQNPIIMVKVLKNHILEGYSDVKLIALFLNQDVKASFSDLREFNGVKTECP
jgi:hypothetical protein